MIEIQRPGPAPGSLWEPNDTENRLRRFLAKMQQPNPRRSPVALVRRGHLLACEAAALNTADPRIRSGLECMAQGGAAAYRMARPQESRTESFEVLGHTILISPYQADNTVTPTKWLHAVFAAVALNDHNAARLLCEDETVSVLFNIPGLSFGNDYANFVRLTQAWVRREDPHPWLARLQDVEAKAGSWWADILRPTQELLQVAVTGQMSFFDGLLGEALTKHRRYYSQGDETGNYEQWIALWPLGIVAWASATYGPRGWASRVRSDYLPSIILEQR